VAWATGWPPMSDESSQPAGWSRFATVRSRLTLLATAVVAVVLVVSAIGLVGIQRRLLTRGIDEALRQRIDNIEPDIAHGVFGTELPGGGDREDRFLQLLDNRGRVVAASANVQGAAAAAPPLAPGAKPSFHTVSLPALSAYQFRVLARPVESRPGVRTLVAGKNLDDVDESVRILTTSLTLAIPAVVTLLGFLVWWLTGRVLRPVESIRSEVASIQGTELHRRVPVPGSYDEISRLARTMNEMLDRVEHAIGQQRRFVADASHELRSPLTRIRSDLEVGIAYPHTRDPDSTYRSLLADTISLQGLVDDLLFRARSESGPISRPSEPIDLDDLVLEEAQRLRERGRVQVDVRAVSAARVLGDAEQLARAIRNLTSNAERHATRTVTLELREDAEHSLLVVADDGPGIPAQHHATVFKPFARLDEARSRDAGGSGLGLAIVHDIVEHHRGAVTIASSDGEGARFVVTLPRAD
jgi:signal transduction histidine kinase